MSRFRNLLALVALLALLTAACGNDDDTAADESDDDPATTLPQDPDTDAGSDPESDQAEQPPEGAAATVDTTEITVDTVEEIFDEVAAAPVLAEQLEGEEGEQLGSMLRAQILGQLISQEIVIQQAAADFGIELTEADLTEAYDDFAAEMGGEDAFEAELEAAGLSIPLFQRLELPLLTTLMKLEEEFGVDEPVGPDGEPSEAQAELQAWAFDQFAVTEVRVAQRYGSWNPETAQVMPAGMPAMDVVPDAEMVPEG